MAVGIDLSSGTDAGLTGTILSTAEFGDGYEYTLPLGYNSLTGQYRLTFNNRPTAQIDMLETFLEAQLGSTAFDYTYIKGELAGVPQEETVKVKCSEWTVVNRTLDVASLRCTLRRVY